MFQPLVKCQTQIRKWLPTPTLLLYTYIRCMWWWKGSLTCCSTWGDKQSDTTEQLNWTEVTPSIFYKLIYSLKVKRETEVAQLHWTLRNPMDCSPPGPSVHGIFQARVLEWGAISFSRGSSQPRNQTRISCVAGRFITAVPPDLAYNPHSIPEMVNIWKKKLFNEKIILFK